MASVDGVAVLSTPSFSNPGLELVSCNGHMGHVGQRKPCKSRTRHLTGYCPNHRHQAHAEGCPAARRIRAVYSEQGCTCGVFRG